MNEVKRYGSAVFDSGLIEMACGDYVTYSDYQKLVAENAAMKDINAWCRTDAFQNMYREFKIAEAAGCDTVDCMHDAMLTAIMHAPATPATDAAIAEIGAKAIEAEFSRTPDAEIKWDGTNLTVQNVNDWFSFGVTPVFVAANLRAGRKG